LSIDEEPLNVGTGLFHLFKTSLWTRIFISRIAFYYCMADLSWVDKRTGRAMKSHFTSWVY